MATYHPLNNWVRFHTPPKIQWITRGCLWWPVTCWSKHRAKHHTRRLHSSSNGWIEAYSIWCHSQTFHLLQGFLYTWLWWAKRMGQKEGLSKLRWFWLRWFMDHQPSTSPTEACTAMSALHLPRLESWPAGVPWSLSKFFALPTWIQPWHKGISPSKKNWGFSRGYSLPFVCDGWFSKAHDIGRSNAQLLHLLKVGLENPPKVVQEFNSPTQFLSIPKTPPSLKPKNQSPKIYKFSPLKPISLHLSKNDPLGFSSLTACACKMSPVGSQDWIAEE